MKRNISSCIFFLLYQTHTEPWLLNRGMNTIVISVCPYTFLSHKTQLFAWSWIRAILVEKLKPSSNFQGWIKLETKSGCSGSRPGKQLKSENLAGAQNRTEPLRLPRPNLSQCTQPSSEQRTKERNITQNYPFIRPWASACSTNWQKSRTDGGKEGRRGVAVKTRACCGTSYQIWRNLKHTKV